MAARCRRGSPRRAGSPGGGGGAQGWGLPPLRPAAHPTHRVVVVDEGWRTGSLAAEVSARIMEGGFYDLDVPVARVCSAEVPMPYPKHLEDAALPQAETIVATVRGMLPR